MYITFLGTGAGLPSKERNTQTIMLNLNPYSNEYWLFDCGEAAQHRILNTNIKLGKLTTIFITHLHGDHIFGLPGLITSRSFQGGENQPLTIYGPVGLRAYIETTLMISESHLNYPLHIIELDETGSEFTIRDVDIKVLPLNHRITSFGYRMEFPEMEGNLIQEKLEAAGFIPGPIYKQFKTDDHVEVDGITYDTSEFRTPNKIGPIITVFGDTMPVESERELARNADIIVHESTYLEGDITLSHKYFHTHIDDLAKLAIEENVKMTLINHISNRYMKEYIERLDEDIKLKYPDFNYRLTHDFDTYEFNYEETRID